MPRRIEKLREADPKELDLQHRELSEQIFRLKFQLSTGQAEALKRLRVAKKDLARIHTLVRERELSAPAGPGSTKTPAAARPAKTRTAK
jgi:large subunit ribosomal protein L29